MQVEVDHVKAGVAGAHLAQDGIGVGAVIVQEAAGIMDDLCNLGDIDVKESQGVGVGQHQGGDGIVHLGPEVFQADAAVAVGLDLDDGHAQHGRAGWVGAVGRVGDQDGLALVVAPGLMVGGNQLEAGVLAMGPGHRLQGDGVHAADLGQVLLKIVISKVHIVYLPVPVRYIDTYNDASVVDDPDGHAVFIPQRVQEYFRSVLHLPEKAFFNAHMNTSAQNVHHAPGIFLVLPPASNILPHIIIHTIAKFSHQPFPVLPNRSNFSTAYSYMLSTAADTIMKRDISVWYLRKKPGSLRAITERSTCSIGAMKNRKPGNCIIWQEAT